MQNTVSLLWHPKAAPRTQGYFQMGQSSSLLVFEVNWAIRTRLLQDPSIPSPDQINGTLYLKASETLRVPWEGERGRGFEGMENSQVKTWTQKRDIEFKMWGSSVTKSVTLVSCLDFWTSAYSLENRNDHNYLRGMLETYKTR